MITNKELKARLYGFDGRLQGVRKAIADDAGITPENKRALLNFSNWLEARETSKASLVKYGHCGRALGHLAKQSFASMGVPEVQELVLAIGQTNYSKPYQQAMRLTLKRLFQSIRGLDSDHAPETAWIAVKSVNKTWRAEDMITPSELESMLKACLNDRDKALIATLYYSDCRIGEILTLTNKDVHDYGTHYKLNVDGKTGPRSVTLAEGLDYLRVWLSTHPLARQDVYPLFISFSQDKAQGGYKPLAYFAARKVIQEAAGRAGITKRIHPHLFRHSRSTELAALGMGEPLLCQHGGWVQGSKAAGVYRSLSGTQERDAILEIVGKKTAQGKSVDEITDYLFELSLKNPKARASYRGIFNEWIMDNLQGLLPLVKVVNPKFDFIKGGGRGILVKNQKNVSTTPETKKAKEEKTSKRDV